MQLITWRDGRAANDAFVGGTGRRASHLAAAVRNVRKEASCGASCSSGSVRGSVASTSSAQIGRYDPAVTARNTRHGRRSRNTCLTLQRQQHSQLRRMAQRLSMFTILRNIAAGRPPRWRTHDFENRGLPVRARLQRRAQLRRSPAAPRSWPSSHPVVDASACLATRAPSRRARHARAPGDARRRPTLRRSRRPTTPGGFAFNGRRELAAIEALEPTSSTRRASRAPRRCWTRSAARR